MTSTVGIIVAVVMGLIIIGLIVTVFYYVARLEEANENYLENPYVLMKTCDNDSRPNALPAFADAQRKRYTTINWCMTNSPTLELEAKVKTCNGLSPATIESYAVFYMEQYVPNCSYAWKTAEDVPSKNNIVNDDSTQRSLNSNRDPFAAHLINCGASLGMIGQTSTYPAFNSLYNWMQ